MDRGNQSAPFRQMTTPPTPCRPPARPCSRQISHPPAAVHTMTQLDTLSRSPTYAQRHDHRAIGLHMLGSQRRSGAVQRAGRDLELTNIILLSDGLNTQDRWYGNGFTLTQVMIARGSCDNIKAAGVTIYSIQVNTAAMRNRVCSPIAPAVRRSLPDLGSRCCRLSTQHLLSKLRISR